jgi:hypothetical protein
MDLSDAAHILGMDLKPADWFDDDPQPIHMTDEAIEDAFGTMTREVGNLEDYAPGGDHMLVIRYDTITDLEANLIAMAVGQFIRSKTPAHNITTTYTREG